MQQQRRHIQITPGTPQQDPASPQSGPSLRLESLEICVSRKFFCRFSYGYPVDMQAAGQQSPLLCIIPSGIIAFPSPDIAQSLAPATVASHPVLYPHRQNDPN